MNQSLEVGQTVGMPERQGHRDDDQGNAQTCGDLAALRCRRHADAGVVRPNHLFAATGFNQASSASSARACLMSDALTIQTAGCVVWLVSL